MCAARDAEERGSARVRSVTARRLAAMLALAALVLAGCAPATDPAAAIQGRWHRPAEISGSGVDDPLATLAGQTFELRSGGVLLGLDYDEGTGRAWTVMSGTYAIPAVNQIAVSGKCWQGWESHDCSRTYAFRLDGDQLTFTTSTPDYGSVTYTRIGPVSASEPPPIAPPFPSPTPTEQP